MPTYERYDADRRLEPLVQNYFEQYLGQFPAQVFDKMNENFIRCSFYELVSRYLSSCYTFAIEQNNSVGRSDFEMTGIPGTDYYTDDRVVEFKYYRAKEAEKMLTLTEPLAEHIVQVKKYGEDTKENSLTIMYGLMWYIFVQTKDGSVGKYRFLKDYTSR